MKYTDRIEITYKNGFTRTVESYNVRNFNSLVDWLEKFNNNEDIGMLTLTGRDLGSAISISKSNVASIKFVD